MPARPSPPLAVVERFVVNFGDDSLEVNGSLVVEDVMTMFREWNAARPTTQQAAVDALASDAKRGLDALESDTTANTPSPSPSPVTSHRSRS